MIGRPNVGKSSLVNRFLGSERVIVSEHGGHHPRRDRHRVHARRPRRGPHRHRGPAQAAQRSRGAVDYYAQLRSERAAERADVAIVVCDATEGVTAEDLRVAELAMRTGCATLVALNKWDLGGTDLDDAKARLAKRVRQRPPVITTSAMAPRNLGKLLDKAIELADRRRERVPTPELNRFVAEVVARRPPPAKRGRRLRLLYSAQVERRPPRIAIQVNDRRLITRDWAYFLENQLRDRYALEGVPLIIDFVPRQGSRRRAGGGAPARATAEEA